MTRSDLTHLYFLLDRSGSMQSIKSDIEGGFAAFVDEQRKGAGECRATLAQFDDVYEVVYADRPLADVPPLDLQPRNMTALHDAMGRLITDAGAKLAALPEAERPGTVIVAIMTDGLENASKEWTRPAIKALVEQQTDAVQLAVPLHGRRPGRRRGRRRRSASPAGTPSPTRAARPRRRWAWPAARSASLRAARMAAPAARWRRSPTRSGASRLAE